MKTTRNSILSALIERQVNCKFIRSCKLYSSLSYTCTHVGGKYCGKYRTLNNPSKNNNIELIVNDGCTEELVQ
jgi:hypothetical protein